MRKIEIYEFQMEAIKEALRTIANTYECRAKKSCVDRMVTQAKKYAENALKGDIDKREPYI